MRLGNGRLWLNQFEIYIMFDKERVEKIAEAWVNFNRLAIDAIERDPLTGGLDEVDDIIQRDPGEGWKFIEAVRRMDVDAHLLSNLATGLWRTTWLPTAKPRSRGLKAWQNTTRLFGISLLRRGRTRCRMRCGGGYNVLPYQVRLPWVTLERLMTTLGGFAIGMTREAAGGVQCNK